VPFSAGAQGSAGVGHLHALALGLPGAKGHQKWSHPAWFTESQNVRGWKGHLWVSPGHARPSAEAFSSPAKSPRRHEGPLQPRTAAQCRGFGGRICPPLHCKCVKISHLSRVGFLGSQTRPSRDAEGTFVPS